MEDGAKAPKKHMTLYSHTAEGDRRIRAKFNDPAAHVSRPPWCQQGMLLPIAYVTSARPGHRPIRNVCHSELEQAVLYREGPHSFPSSYCLTLTSLQASLRKKKHGFTRLLGSIAVKPHVPGHFRFLDLPPEIRNMIYTMHFKDDAMSQFGSDVINVCCNYKGSYFRSTYDIWRMTLLAVCRQVHNEAAVVLYGSFTFRLSGIRELREFLGKIGLNRTLLTSIKLHAYRFYKNTWALSQELAEAASLRRVHIVLWMRSTDRLRGPKSCFEAFRPLYDMLQDREDNLGQVRDLVEFSAMDCQIHGALLQKPTETCLSCEESVNGLQDFRHAYESIVDTWHAATLAKKNEEQKPLAKSSKSRRRSSKAAPKLDKSDTDMFEPTWARPKTVRSRASIATTAATAAATTQAILPRSLPARDARQTASGRLSALNLDKDEEEDEDEEDEEEEEKEDEDEEEEEQEEEGEDDEDKDEDREQITTGRIRQEELDTNDEEFAKEEAGEDKDEENAGEEEVKLEVGSDLGIDDGLDEGQPAGAETDFESDLSPAPTPVRLRGS